VIISENRFDEIQLQLREVLAINLEFWRYL
jgi:hypothetical protein